MKTDLLNEADELPLVVMPSSAGETGLDSLLQWSVEQRDWIERQLLHYGAILLRGFDVHTAVDFERFCNSFDQHLLNYVGGDSPRQAVTGKVYTSTEYPAELEIPLHNELSYRQLWPRKLFCFCQQPAQHGGETNIADSRKILAKIDPVVSQRFATKQVAYIQNLHDGWGFGKSWQQTFETDDRASVEAYCRRNNIEFRWSESGLWTRSVCPGVIDHPQTGETVWFNQANLWHVSSRGYDYQQKLLKIFGEDALPSHATYGDGSPISGDELDDIRHACRASEVVYLWQQGDLLILDNVLAAHGRKAYSGPRRILVAMAD
jgi:alpha-ketoglutarate-dependent taurine dioxygenase